MEKSFQSVSMFPGWANAEAWISGIVERFGCKEVLEIGSGANPTLSTDALRRLRIDRYTTNDICEAELKKAPAGYETLCCDFTDPQLAIEERFDLVCSRMVNEHVQDGQKYYANIFRALRPGGITAHAFSTLYSFPFVVNRVMPEVVSSFLLNTFTPRDRHQHEKFRAYYSWSRGPTAKQVSRFESLGFEVLSYTGYFGHTYYRRKLKPLHWLHQRKSAWLLRYPTAHLTSYAAVVLRKPSVPSSAEVW